jgi:exodeoxyribonuclease X
LPDAYVAAFLLRELLELVPVEDLIAWTSEPVLLPRVCFGMYKARPWEELPLDYLDWVVERSDLSEDIKYTADYYRTKRKRAA